MQDKKIINKIKNNSRMRYLYDYTGFPITSNNEVTYYSLGEKIFPVMLEELRKAEKFIFFEYFIVAKGKRNLSSFIKISCTNDVIVFYKNIIKGIKEWKMIKKLK